MDRTKLRALLQEHHTSAWGWALYCSRGERDTAEEILQDAYLQVLEGKASFDGRSAFRTWLFAVIRRIAAKHRFQLTRRIAKLSEKFRDPFISGRETEERIYRSELRKNLDALLARLSGRQREILQLVFYHELTVEDSARVMGVSIGSARTHYQRGKQRLRAEIEKTGLKHEY